VGFRFPSIFSTGISFPRDQILLSTGGTSVGTDGVYFVFLFTFDQFARLGKEVGAKLGYFSVRREE